MSTKLKHNNYTGMYCNLQRYASQTAQSNVQLTYGTQQTAKETKYEHKKAHINDLNFRRISAILYEIQREWCLSIYKRRVRQWL